MGEQETAGRHKFEKTCKIRNNQESILNVVIMQIHKHLFGVLECPLSD